MNEPVFVAGNPDPKPLTQEQKDRVKEQVAKGGPIKPLPDEAYRAVGLNPPVHTYTVDVSPASSMIVLHSGGQAIAPPQHEPNMMCRARPNGWLEMIVASPTRPVTVHLTVNGRRQLVEGALKAYEGPLVVTGEEFFFADGHGFSDESAPGVPPGTYQVLAQVTGRAASAAAEAAEYDRILLMSEEQFAANEERERAHPSVDEPLEHWYIQVLTDGEEMTSAVV